MRYLLISADDANAIAAHLDDLEQPISRHMATIKARLEIEDGGDFEEIVRELKKLEQCAAGVIEGVGCGAAFKAQKIGRRLDRLLERAEPGGRGHRLPVEKKA